MTTAFPYLGDLVKALTGVDLPLPFPMYGLMVAIALLVSVWISKREVRRLHEMGIIGLPRQRSNNKPGTPDGRVPPQEIVIDLALLSVIAGLIGARVFHILEYPDQFMANPWGMIFSRSGFTYYGGLIVGMLVGVAYLHRKGLAIPAFLDALAPAMMLGYAIARIGCQLSGDGDWGIAANMALKPDWLPTWLWAQTYQHNVAGVAIAPPGAYPTPIYETLMCGLAFVVLWSVRKHPFQPGWLFALYLLLTGVERLAIETIRVNSVISVFGMAVTQAQLISAALIVVGAGGLVYLSRRNWPARS